MWVDVKLMEDPDPSLPHPALQMQAPCRKRLQFVKRPSNVTPAQTLSCTKNVTQTETKSKNAVQQPMKPIIKMDPNANATIREVQSDHKDPFTEEDLEDLANLPTDVEPEDLENMDTDDNEDPNMEQ